MVVKLIVRVQADLLPLIADGTGATISQVGLRLSAMVDLPANETLRVSPLDLLKDLCPWHWRASDPGLHENWNPHNPAAWRLFRVDGSAPVEITTKIAPPAGLDPGMNGDFTLALEQTLAIVVDEGAEASVCLPADGQPIERRTVFGMVESLTGLPHPIPAGMRVFTVLSVAEDLSNTRVVAIPRFLPPVGGSFDIDNAVFFDIDPVGVITADAVHNDPSPWADTLRFELRASLDVTAMARVTNAPQLVDLSKLSIGQNDNGTETGDEDYAAHLPIRLAEAIDPAARLIGAFDPVVEGLRSSTVAADIEDFAALKADLSNRETSSLLALFDVMTADVFQPMARSSEAASSVALSRFGAAARERGPDGRRTEAAQEAGQIFLRMLDRDQTGGNFEPDRARPPLMPYSRLATTVGVPPEDIKIPAQEPASLDSEAGLLEFVRGHWLSPIAGAADAPRPISKGSKRELVSRILTCPTLDLAVHNELVLDAGVLVAPGPKFVLSLMTPGDCARLTIGMTQLTFLRDAANLITVSASGGATTAVRSATLDILGFMLTLSDDRATLHVTFDDGQPPFDVAVSDLARGLFSVTLEAVDGAVADFQPTRPNPLTARRFAENLTAQGVRSDLSLAFAGPYLPGILAGRQDWSTKPGPTSPPEDFRKAIRDGVAALAPALLEKLSQRVQNPTWLTRLIGRIIEQATDDAVRLAIAAVPSAALERITMDAPPLVVRIDQFQDFGSEDAWGRVAGYGALLGRSAPSGGKAATPEEWWTLNAAELFAVAPKDPMNPAKPGDPKRVGLVDPVAIQIGQGGGVRQSLLSYNNRWLATGLATDTVHDAADAQSDGPRRPERMQPPSSLDGYRLPALSFGYAFWVLPYLIGHGGALPVWLRETAANPLVRRGSLGKPIADPLKDVIDNARLKTYLRTRPVGAPRIKETVDKPALPSVPENIAPLAGELPIRPAPVTLEPTGSAMYFRDVSGQRGILSSQAPADGLLAGFRILFGDVCRPGSTYEAKRLPVSKLNISLWGTIGDAVAAEQLWSSPVLQDVVNDLRLSFLFGDGNDLIVRLERQNIRPDFTEDEGVFEVATDTVTMSDIWRDMFVEISVPDGETAVQFEPPVAVDIQRAIADDLLKVDSLDTGKPNVAPEAGHRSRVISLFDSIPNNGKIVVPGPVTLRRPSVEFGTYERWINPALIETSGEPPKHKTAVSAALNDAYALSTGDPGQQGTRQEVSFEDPAVTAFCVELVEIFPRQRSIGIQVSKAITGDAVFAPAAATATIANGRLAHVVFDYGAASLTSTSPSEFKAVVQAGRIYELRSYAVVAGNTQAFSPFSTLDRISAPVRATLRKVKVSGSEYLLASPNIVTIEVTTLDLPAVYTQSRWSMDQRLIVLDRPPSAREDTARIYLPEGLTGGDAELYRKTRYAARASLYSQRWSWRGHPQAEITTRGGQGLLNSNWTTGIADLAFVGRRNDDVGDVMVRRLEKAHIYGGRKNLSEASPSPPSTALFTKALDWRAGLNLWRFGFSLTSRYAPLFPRHISPEALAHIGASGPAWAVQAVPDRPSGRTIARPGLALVLPLTEPLMAGGATPPLLALFNERVYANFNLADGIDVAIDVARHPFTYSEQKAELERLKAEDPVANADAIRDLEKRLAGHIPSLTDSLKYWQEFGPDPIRTGSAHDGSPVLLRADGPLGYTFDAETEAGRFDHAGLLLSPVAQEYRPWSMIKLRFRRLEAPEGLAGFQPITLTEQGSTVPLGGKRFPPDNSGIAIDYEGLLIDVASLEEQGKIELGLSLGNVAKSEIEMASVTVTASRKSGKLIISTRTRLGDAGVITLDIGPQEKASLRIFISGRERPQGVENWTPQGDVAIKLRISDTRMGIDVLERLDRDHWLAVNCVPLGGLDPVGPDEIIKVHVYSQTSSEKLEAKLSPVRLSPFTPSVWCQFAESMSVLSANLGGDSVEKIRLISVGELEAKWATKKNGGAGLTLELKQVPGEATPPALRSLSTSAPTVSSAQLDEILLAVVTRYVTDAFARLRERPVGVIHLTDLENRPVRTATDKDAFFVTLQPDSQTEAWWSDEAKPPQQGNGGRVRFLRVLVPRARELGGFVERTTRGLEALFNQDLIAPDDLNPADAAGQILGISRPIEWR